jgi:hypothetical protein
VVEVEDGNADTPPELMVTNQIQQLTTFQNTVSAHIRQKLV